MGANTQEPDVYVPNAYAVAVPVSEAEPEIVVVPICVSAPPEDQLPDAFPSEKMSQINVPSEKQTQTVTETAEDKKEPEKTEEKDPFESMTSQVSQMLSSITGTVNNLNKNQGSLQKDWNSMTKAFKTLSKNLSPILNLFKGCGVK
jgi:hypothetical protein